MTRADPVSRADHCVVGSLTLDCHSSALPRHGSAGLDG